MDKITLGEYLDSTLNSDIELFEMANLPVKYTGMEHGTIYISTKQGNHGPRVKYYRGNPGTNNSASITISDDPKVVHDSIEYGGINTREERQVKKFILLNKDALLDFWYNGNSLNVDEVSEFVKKLVKIK